MKCPTCRKEVPVPSEYMPFCSERCKLIDLGAWASEKYVISTPLKPDDPELPPAPGGDDADED